MSDVRRVIVIGSGPSGAIAALVLLQQGIPVTLLESGHEFPGGFLLRFRGRNVFRRRPPLEKEQGHVSSDNPDAVWYRALVPGGLTNYWTGAVPRFAPEDFYEGARLHEKYRWPVSYSDLIPYYRYVEQLMGVSGTPEDAPALPASDVLQPKRLPRHWERIAAHAQSFGHGLVPLPMADVKSSMLTRSGAAFNSFTQIVPLLRRFPGFELRLGAHAMCLEWSGKHKKVRSVTYFDRATDSHSSVEGAAVVVACGPLASTKLLLDSACTDFPHGLGNTDGILGRYLHDHPKDWCVVELDKPLHRLGQAAYLTRTPYNESPPLLGAAAMIGNSGGSARQKILTFTPLPSTMFGVTVFGTMIPTPDNYVGQHSQLRDEFGLPVLDLHIQYGNEVVPTMETIRERLGSILDSAGYRARFPDEPLAPYPGNSVHYAGSIRMHNSPTYGMLNGWNRLHAIDNVIVADASCFTTAVEKNPVLTATALSARAAFRLASDLKASTCADSSPRPHLSTIG